MDPAYRASVTDCPTYVLSVAIDGRKKEVEDYVGSWEGMPEVVTELENEVDAFAGTARWIKGGDGLAQALQAEKFDFKSFEAQATAKAAATHGEAGTLTEFLEADMPLAPLPAPKPKEPDMGIPFANVGWLTAASSHIEALQVLIDAGASKSDQHDKDLALVGAARSGQVDAVRLLIAYGANPNADLSKLIVTERISDMSASVQSAGSVLIFAARSGNPEVVREILHYHPKLEERDREGQTAVFAAGEYQFRDVDGERVKCVRLLAEAGADVNARDNEGNTPLHETFLTDVEEELLKLGADVNARNNDGETPIFTTVDDDAIPLFIEHGADLTIRNNDGKTAMEAALEKGPQRQDAFRKAIESLNQPQ